jgi:hypothetical protein
MCTGVSIAAIIGALATTYSAVSTAQAAKSRSAAPAAAITQLATPPPESQASKTPAQSSYKKMVPGGGLPGGGDPTLLTGPGGVNSDTLTLGKATLLGS